MTPQGKAVSENMDILVVVDMQKDFIDGALGTPEAVAIVPAVNSEIDRFHCAWHDGGFSQPNIFYTLDTHEPDYLETQEGVNLPVEHCLEGTDGWKLGVSYREDGSSQRFCKRTFGSYELAKHLVELEQAGTCIDSIEIVGLCTDICVISNAMVLKVALPEVPITVKSSCCAGVTPRSHERALEAMKPCQIHVAE